MPNDPKWRTIARASGRSIPEVQSVFLQLMVSASANANERGRTQVNNEDIASALDMQIEHVEAITEAMEGRVTEGNLLTGWHGRQPEREDGSAERSRAWREKNKRDQHANATERTRTQTNAREEERREEEKREEQPSSSPPDPISKVAADVDDDALDWPEAKRIVCDTVGIHDMRQQSDMDRCIDAYAKASGKSPPGVVEHMTARWQAYRAESPSHEWQYGSAHKFFMSGKWDDPRSWPRGKDSSPVKLGSFERSIVDDTQVEQMRGTWGA